MNHSTGPWAHAPRKPRLYLPVFHVTGWLVIMFLALLLFTALASHVVDVISVMSGETVKGKW